MSGGGGSIGHGWNPKELAQQVREAERRVQSEAFRSELEGLILSLLSRINDRDANVVQQRLEEILASLRGVLADHIDQIFGGSVAKHTYVDGLSDIDCLLIVNGEDLAQQGPKATLNKVATTLSEQLAEKAEVSVGDMAVTVKYSDQLEIQLLPAARDGDRLVIPSSRVPGEWSAVNPKKISGSTDKM